MPLAPAAFSSSALVTRTPFFRLGTVGSGDPMISLFVARVSAGADAVVVAVVSSLVASETVVEGWRVGELVEL